MTPDEFYVAQLLESEGWEYLGVMDDGDISFTRRINGVIFSMSIRESK